MTCAQGSLYSLVDVVNHPGKGSFNDLMRLTTSFYLVIDVEFYIQHFSFRGIVINPFLRETVNISIVNLDDKNILGLGQVVNPNFCKRLQPAQCNYKRKYWVLRFVFVIYTDNMFTHGKLTKLSV